MPKFADSILKKELDHFYAKMLHVMNLHASSLHPPETFAKEKIEQWKKRKAHSSRIFNFILQIRTDIYSLISYFDEGKQPGLTDWVGIIRKVISIWQQYRGIIPHKGEEIFSVINEDGSKDKACYEFCKIALRAFASLPADINQLFPFVAPQALSLSIYVPLLATLSLKPAENPTSANGAASGAKLEVNKANTIQNVHRLTVSEKLFGQPVHLPRGDFIEHLPSKNADILEAQINLSMFLQYKKSSICMSYYYHINDYCDAERGKFEYLKDFFIQLHQDIEARYSKINKSIVVRKNKNFLYKELLTIDGLLKDIIPVLAAMQSKFSSGEIEECETSLIEYDFAKKTIIETNLSKILWDEANFRINDLWRICAELQNHQLALTNQWLNEQYELYYKMLNSEAVFQNITTKVQKGEQELAVALRAIYPEETNTDFDGQIQGIEHAIATYTSVETVAHSCLERLERLKQIAHEAKRFPDYKVDKQLMDKFNERIEKNHQEVMTKIERESEKLQQRLHFLVAKKVELTGQLSIIQSQKQMALLAIAGKKEEELYASLREEITALTRRLRCCEVEVQENLTKVSQLLTVDPANRMAILREAQTVVLRCEATLKDIERDCQSYIAKIPAEKKELIRALQGMASSITQQSTALKHQLLIASGQCLTDGIATLSAYNPQVITRPLVLSISTFWHLLDSIYILEDRVAQAKKRTAEFLLLKDLPKDFAYLELVTDDIMRGDWFSHAVSIPETIQLLQSDIGLLRQQLQDSQDPIAPDFYMAALSKIEHRVRAQSDVVRTIRSSLHQEKLSWIEKMIGNVTDIIHYHSPLGKLQSTFSPKHFNDNKNCIRNYRDICDRLPVVIDDYARSVDAISHDTTAEVKKDIDRVLEVCQTATWEVQSWRKQIDRRECEIQENEQRYLERKRLVDEYKIAFKIYLKNRAKNVLYLLKDIFVIFSDDTQIKRRKYLNHLSGLLDNYVESGNVDDAKIAIAEIQKAKQGYLNAGILTKNILTPLEAVLAENASLQPQAANLSIAFHSTSPRQF